MSHVSVTINGRQYRMACDDGQEAHLARLAHELDRRIDGLRKEFGEIGDMRLTVMAALTLSDELAEMGQRLHGLEQDLAELEDARRASADHAQATQTAIVAAFNSAAERIETVARRISGTTPPAETLAE
jgi:cell division protein ZapA